MVSTSRATSPGTAVAFGVILRFSKGAALASGWEVAIHPDDLPRILDTFRDALNSLKPGAWR